jgi:deoxyhypusine synthase
MHLLHRRQPGGGHLQPGGPRPLRAHPHWRDSHPETRWLCSDKPPEPRHRHLHPEEEAIRRLERSVLDEWTRADKAGERYFPHEFFYRILRSAS